MLYFYKGFKVKLIDATSMGHHIKVVEDRNLIPIQCSVGSEHIVPPESLEDLCEESYAIGDVVQTTFSAIDNNLVGTVVGYEPSENRVVVKSVRICNYKEDRTRYSYKLHEIQAYRENSYLFKVGRMYRINGALDLKAVECPSDFNTVLMVNQSGKVIYQLPINSFLPGLALRHGISKVELIR